MLIINGELSLSGVSAGRWINSDPIDATFAKDGLFNLWSTINGDPGKTGSGVSIIWGGSFQRSATTYYVTPTGTVFIRESGTSKNGPKSIGVDSATFTPDLFPFIKLRVRHGGSATTSTAKVVYSLVMQ